MGEINWFIPKKLNVGFQNRSDTFSGKLAYVTYFDENGKLRKETSWNNWRSEKIPNQVLDNTLTEGFVLNKNVGGKRGSWFDFRKSYIRVYDPRGFEIEITLDNLMYILKCTDCVGSVLQGKFVYAWAGTELVLMPKASPDYEELDKLNKTRFEKKTITSKDAVVGATYLNKKGDKLVYLGKFDYYPWGEYCDGMFFEFTNGYSSRKLENYIDSKNLGGEKYFVYPTQRGQALCGQRYFFSYLKNGDIVALKDFSSFIDIVDSEKIEDFDDRMSELEKKEFYSPVDNSKDEYVPYTYEDFLNECNNSRNGFKSYALIGEDMITSVFIMKYGDLCIIGIPDDFSHKGEFGRNYVRFSLDPIFSSDEIRYLSKLKLNYLSCGETVALVSPQEAFERLKLVTVKKHLRNGTLYKNNHLFFY